jgi:hypothetical protein
VSQGRLGGEGLAAGLEEEAHLTPMAAPMPTNRTTPIAIPAMAPAPRPSSDADGGEGGLGGEGGNEGVGARGGGEPGEEGGTGGVGGGGGEAGGAGCDGGLGDAATQWAANTPSLAHESPQK